MAETDSPPSFVPDTLLADAAPAVAHPAPKLLLAALVAIVGDQLLYERTPGISVALYLGLIGLAVAVADPLRAPLRDRCGAVLILLAGLLPLVEGVGFLSITSGILGTALFAAGMRGAFSLGIGSTGLTVGTLLVVGPFRLVPDLATISQRIPVRRLTERLQASLLGWLVPLLLCCLFASLFASANPIIDAWLAELEWSIPAADLDTLRLLAWGVLLSVAWAFVTARRITARGQRAENFGPALPAPVAAGLNRWIDASLVLRSLILFNLLFALQSGLDLAYLWGGVALPSGITYASYAHRGAYPLILTALLAAGFVLVALRPGGPGEGSRTIRGLVYLWIWQNVLLVVSALLRLDLYVATYSLTLPRAAAFVWMGLVGAGLILILARIALRRTNTWLIAANGLILAATLYACAFVNVAGFVADYNLVHSRRAGTPFDAYYALSLGPQAIPAVDRWIADAASRQNGVVAWRNELAAAQIGRMAEWRAWTFRDGRLLGYLQGHRYAPTPGGAGTP